MDKPPISVGSAETGQLSEVSADPSAGDAPSAALTAAQRLEKQLDWYGSASRRHKLWYQWLKVAQLVIAAAIPVVAAAGASAAVAGALGAVVVVLEGVQQLFQFQQNWISYRGTAEGLKREKYLYLSRAGPYAEVTRPDALLAERVEELVAQETAGWAESHLATGGRPARGGETG